MENTKNKQLTEQQIKNIVKYNFFRTLNSGEFGVDISKFENRINDDFKKMNIEVSQSEIDDMIWLVIHNKRYELMELLF